MNRQSRHTAHALEPLAESLGKHGLRVAEFHTAADGAEVRRLVKGAAKAGAETVIVGGGDGTMAHAVDVLAHRKTVLGLVPLGTGNSFAQTLAIPRGDVDAAIAVIAAGKIASVDLGRVNGTYFANFATIGLSTEIAGAASPTAKGLLGPIAYAIAAIGPVFSHRAFRARIRWRGGELKLRTQDIIIANGRYFGSTPVTPDASITDGRLNLFTTDDPSRIGALRTYLAFGMHDQTKLRDAHVVTATKFTIRTKARQMIAIDGSLLEKTPARIRVVPQALRVFVP
ncbi:MAG: diacylglycerol kinase catalytic subunit [Candidatus Eremiobacteraeota bacterium]|nr:diacylglycerol kinase catalytic subunit [Candidatus Eremiobacteraeota bacterium]